MQKFFYIFLVTLVFNAGSSWAQVAPESTSSEVYSQAEKTYGQWYQSLRFLFTENSNRGYYGANDQLIKQTEDRKDVLSAKLAIQLHNYGATQGKPALEVILKSGNVDSTEAYLNQHCNVQQLIKQKASCETGMAQYAKEVVAGSAKTTGLKQADFYASCINVGVMASCLEFTQQTGREYILNVIK